MCRSLGEEQRGLSLSWAATAGGSSPAHPKERQDSGRDVALPGETVITLPKSENIPMQQPRGGGARHPWGHWSSTAGQGPQKVPTHREGP